MFYAALIMFILSGLIALNTSLFKKKKKKHTWAHPISRQKSFSHRSATPEGLRP